MNYNSKRRSLKHLALCLKKIFQTLITTISVHVLKKTEFDEPTPDEEVNYYDQNQLRVKETEKHYVKIQKM